MDTVLGASSRLDSIHQHVKHNILLNTFKDSTGVDVRVFLKVRIKPEYWGQVPTNNHYYVIEALRADAIRITGKVDRMRGGESSFLQKTLSAVTATTTVANILLDAAIKFDSTNNSLYSFYNNKVDSFDLVLKKSEVYFTARYPTTTENLDQNYSNTILKCANSDANRGSLAPIHIGSQKSVSLFPEINRNGYNNICSFDVSGSTIIIDINFEYDEKTKVGTVVLKDRSPLVNTEIYRDARPIGEGVVSFENTYIYTLADKVVNKGLLRNWKKVQRNHVAYIDYNIDFNPIEKTITILNHKSGAYQTDVYVPKKDDVVEMFPNQK